MSNKTFISLDLGATKCAAAIVNYHLQDKVFICEKHCTFKLKSVTSLAELIAQIENELRIKIRDADAICVGAAGMYDGEQLHLEAGYPYPMTFAKLAKEQNWPAYTIIHDYAPIVCATFTAQGNDPQLVRKLNQKTSEIYGRRVALGVGTGLGLKDGVLFPDGNFWLGTNEIGHIGITFPPLTSKIYEERHKELIKFLKSNQVLKENESLTFEKILSGPGTFRLHRFLYPDCQTQSPEELGIKLREGRAPETMKLFAWYLGLFIGNVQLAFMPSGGIWLTGGVLLNHIDVFDNTEFQKGIEATPAYMSQRSEFPLAVLERPEHAFIGGAYYAAQKLI